MTDQILPSPVGRLLNMYLFDKRATDHRGKPKELEKQSYEVWVAFRKDDPAWPAYWQQAQNAAQVGFPGRDFNNPALPFSWKYKDGDGMDATGKPMAAHCHGCHLVSYTSKFAPGVFNAQNQQIAKEHDAVKAGDYVEIYGSFKGNDNADKPGIYANVNMVRVVGYGQAIISGPSAEQAFGAAPVALPAGASATPTAPLNSVAPLGTPAGAAMAAPGAVAPVMAAPGAVAPVMAAPGAVAPMAAPGAVAPMAAPGVVAPVGVAPGVVAPVMAAPGAVAPGVVPNAAPVAAPAGVPNGAPPVGTVSPGNAAPAYAGYMNPPVPGQ